MKIVSLDLATKTGWAFLDTEPEDAFGSDVALKSGTRDFSLRTWEGDVDRNHAAKLFFANLIKGCDVVFYERIEFQHRSMAAARVYFGLETVLEMTCLEMQVKLKPAKPSDIKREATGKGNGKKDKMEDLARIQFPDQKVQDNNQADALWLMRFAARKMGVPMERHVEELF